MKKDKLFIAAGLLVMLSLSACGIFKKGCNCPPISKVSIVQLVMPC